MCPNVVKLVLLEAKLPLTTAKYLDDCVIPNEFQDVKTFEGKAGSPRFSCF